MGACVAVLRSATRYGGSVNTRRVSTEQGGAQARPLALDLLADHP
jgi:hypothetical protein